MTDSEKIIKISKIINDIRVKDTTLDELDEAMKLASFNDLKEALWEFHELVETIANVLNG